MLSPFTSHSSGLGSVILPRGSISHYVNCHLFLHLLTSFCIWVFLSWHFSVPFILIFLFIPWLGGSMRGRTPEKRWGLVLELGHYGMGLQIRRRCPDLLHQSNVFSYLPLRFLASFNLLVELIFPLPMLLAFFPLTTHYPITRGCLVPLATELLCGRLGVRRACSWGHRSAQTAQQENAVFSKTQGTRINFVIQQTRNLWNSRRKSL